MDLQKRLYGEVNVVFDVPKPLYQSLDAMLERASEDDVIAHRVPVANRLKVFPVVLGQLVVSGKAKQPE